MGTWSGDAWIITRRGPSLRKPTRSQEANVKEKASACSFRNDGWVGGMGEEGTMYRTPRKADSWLRSE
jgi:hypothetical protein